MNLFILKEGVKQLTTQAMKNSPTILTVMASVGVVSTTILSIVGTSKAIRALDAARYQREIDERETGLVYERDLNNFEKAKIVWVYYLPTVVVGGITIASIVSANTINFKRNAALMSLYTIADKALTEYQEKVVEIVGKNKEEKIRQEISQNRIDNDPLIDKQVIVTGKGETTCYDSLSGRYFKCDMETIRRVQNDINHSILGCDGFATLNSFYETLGLEHTELGNDMGWSMDKLLDIDLSAKLANGEPCIVLNYRIAPTKF